MNNRLFTLQSSTGITRSNRVGQPSTIWQPDPNKPMYMFTDHAGFTRVGQIRDMYAGWIEMEFAIGGWVCTNTVDGMDKLTAVQS